MVFVVNGRYDNKYLGSCPEFVNEFDNIEDAKKNFYDEIEKGAKTIFLEHYNKWGEQTKCYNIGFKLVDC